MWTRDWGLNQATAKEMLNGRGTCISLEVHVSTLQVRCTRDRRCFWQPFHWPAPIKLANDCCLLLEMPMSSINSVEGSDTWRSSRLYLQRPRQGGVGERRWEGSQGIGVSTMVWRVLNVSVRGCNPLFLYAALTNLYCNYEELIFCCLFISFNYRYATRVHSVK